MEHRTDAELARLAYGRATTERERELAEQAAVELDRRRHERATLTDGEPGGTDGSVEAAHTALGDPSQRRRRMLTIMIIAIAIAIASVVAVGLIAQALTPRPSLEIFDRPPSDADLEIEQQLTTFDPGARVRVIGAEGESTFFAALTAEAVPAVDALVCVGVAEFGAITIIECLSLAEFEASGVDTEIPLSPETGGIRIGEGYRYTWGPTGDFSVQRLPPAE